MHFIQCFQSHFFSHFESLRDTGVDGGAAATTGGARQALIVHDGASMGSRGIKYWGGGGGSFRLEILLILWCAQKNVN